MWEALDHQTELADIGLKILRENAMVYLAMEERTGKTVTAMLICENSSASRIAVLSTIKALSGWKEALHNFPHLCSYELMNYHSAHKLKGKYDLIILDEAHNYISSYPKHNGIWKEVAKLTKDVPIIYSSATPHAQGRQMLYGQFALSTWSPWAQYRTYYDWYKQYAERDKNGGFKMSYVSGNVQAVDYTAVQDERIKKEVEHLFVKKTRQELGMKDPKDILHYIELSDEIKEVYNALVKDKYIEFTSRASGIDYKLVCDTPTKLRSSLHMLEGGGLKFTRKVNEREIAEYVVLSNREKIDYILKTWGDTEDVVIMYNYIVEKEKLEKEFKHARILQAQTYAEGVDLSGHKHLIIYSQGFSTAKHTQRRARQANRKRVDPINVHFLLVKKAVSEQVYKAVSINKVNFVDSVFERTQL